MKKQLRNLCHTRRIKEVKILNPAVLMGIRGSPEPSTETMYDLWGLDPVHPTQKAYKLMAERVLEEAGADKVVHPRKPVAAAAGTDQKKRETWTSSTPTVANRRGKWADNNPRAGHYKHTESGLRGGHQWRPKRGGYRGYRGGFRGNRGRPN